MTETAEGVVTSLVKVFVCVVNVGEEEKKVMSTAEEYHIPKYDFSYFIIPILE